MLPRSAAEQRLSDSCRHEASGGKLLAVWSTQSVCVEHTERVQLQPHAKLVAIQTEACPAVRSPTTQPRPRPPLDPTTQLPAPSLRLGWSLR